MDIDIKLKLSFGINWTLENLGCQKKQITKV